MKPSTHTLEDRLDACARFGGQAAAAAMTAACQKSATAAFDKLTTSCSSQQRRGQTPTNSTDLFERMVTGWKAPRFLWRGMCST